MSIDGIQRAAPLVASASSADLPVNPTRASLDAQPVAYDPETNQPVPLRFPWLTRLSIDLERAARRSAPYGTASVLGNRIDKLA